ncbi:MAG: DEAD/DEAH box helicase [Gammaproteobacteria bacterium]|nr:DEAD/DEAH box helicase [Gammaproteobacteria bacterium]MDH5650699.1 DEAD/DEAH box helicase [Gammaproteobacteria bacterium]
MTSDNISIIEIDYDPIRLSGLISKYSKDITSSIWERIKSRLLERNDEFFEADNTIELSWIDTLCLIREFGSASVQKKLGFRFRPKERAKPKIQEFLAEVRKARESFNSIAVTLSEQEITSRLLETGFTERLLKSFQIRDLQHLLALPHGANFSVPGAGKTTVTFALHLLARQKGWHFLIVCPKAAFPAWREVVRDCMSDDAPNYGAENFTYLDGSEENTHDQLISGSTRFIISYDLLVRQKSTISSYLSRTPVHLVLDESHRMKAGLGSQRGSFLLNIASLPVRRDILSGTPMPQHANDIASQLGFLWPGHGLDLQIQRGHLPRDVLGQLYVRTTKQELGLPPAKRHFYQISMDQGQQALYAIVRNEVLRQLIELTNSKTKDIDFLSARKSVIRLLQISVNPTLALRGMTSDGLNIDSGIIDAIIEEGASAKMKAVADHARDIANSGKKAVIWTIFTNNIIDLEGMLVELNPLSIYGAIPSGNEDDLSTREGRLKRFHLDDACKVLIANPAAAGEGISLHKVCHDAIYLDRSFVSTHYLQSIDRIHRLGLAPDIETNIHIYQSKAPVSLGSIDLSVSRRLALKIRNMQQLLDDPDLHEVALDEENADDPIDYDINLQDLIALIEELEGKTTDNGMVG